MYIWGFKLWGYFFWAVVCKSFEIASKISIQSTNSSCYSYSRTSQDEHHNANNSSFLILYSDNNVLWYCCSRRKTRDAVKKYVTCLGGRDTISKLWYHILKIIFEYFQRSSGEFSQASLIYHICSVGTCRSVVDNGLQSPLLPYWYIS